MTENGSESLPFEPPEEENVRLREENARLRRLLAAHSIPIPQLAPEKSPATKAVEPASPVDKEERARRRIALFRSLFHGREDVYARRWENDVMRHILSPRTFRYFPGWFSDFGDGRMRSAGYDTCWCRQMRVSRSKNPFGAPGKSGRAIFAFYSPGPPLGSSPKKCRFFCFCPVEERTLPRRLSERERVSRFLRSRSVASALGIHPGATPSGQPPRPSHRRL